MWRNGCQPVITACGEIYSCYRLGMGTKTINRPTQKQLREWGLSAAHAHDLWHGKKLPSMGLAQRIEAEFGYPIGSWRLAEKQAAA